MSIEHDEKMPRLSTRIDKLMSWWVWNMMRKDASAINSSWWVDELMSIEHDEKRWFGNQLIRSLTCQPASLPTCQPLLFVRFSARNLTLWVPFYPSTTNLAAKNRFSRRLFLMQNEVSMRMQQNEYLFLENLICTIFWAICSKMHCVLVQNKVRFGAKCTAICC